MYTYHPPHPIILNLADEEGFRLRQKTAEYVAAHLNVTGAERGKPDEQESGALAEMVIRSKLGLSEINDEDHPLGYDFALPSGVKIDVKCRGGEFPFQEEYASSDEIPREAKHNLWARQAHNPQLDADVYLLTHLLKPKKKERLPGTKRQRKWILYVCGWVSKDRAISEGVYVPRGSLTEQGKTWFTYRGQEIEFYNRNLNGLADIKDLLSIGVADVNSDKRRKGDLNLTSVDAVRIGYDMLGRGIISSKQLAFIEKEAGLTKFVKPILHTNQYIHLLKWLSEKDVLTREEMEKAKNVLKEELFEGI